MIEDTCYRNGSGPGKVDPIHFPGRCLRHPAPPSGAVCLGTLPASSSPLQLHQRLYQILVETWKGKNISRSESFNLSPRVLLRFLKRGGLENVFPISSRLSARAVLPSAPRRFWPLGSLGKRGLEQGQACQKERGRAALSGPLPPLLLCI